MADESASLTRLGVVPLAMWLGLIACGLSITGADTEQQPGAGGGVDAASDAPLISPTADGSSGGGCTADVRNDRANCGTCGHDCLGGACVEGRCQPVVVVDKEAGAFGLAIHGDALVWTRPSAGLVRSRPLVGGDVTTILSRSNVTDVASDGTRLFLTLRGEEKVIGIDAVVGNWEVTSPGSPTGIATDGVRVYWTVQSQDGVQSLEIRNPKTPFVTEATNLNWPADVAVHGGLIFSASASGIRSTVPRPPDGNGNHKMLSPTDRFRDGGGDLNHTGLVADDRIIYFTIGEEGIVASVPIAGGDAVVIVPRQEDPQGIAMTATAVYWANQGSGKIMMVAR